MTVRQGILRPLELPTLVLLLAAPAMAGAQTWNGNGPYPSGPGSRTVNALAIDPATGTVYAGTGSGTVFASSDASLSEPPQAFDDSALTQAGAAVDIELLANDIDPEGAPAPASVELQTGPASGTAAINADGTVTYAPDTGFTGADSFSYTMRDLAGNQSNAAEVTVRVNALPTAADDAASTAEGETVTIDVLANDTDSDGTVDPATVAMWNSPVNGGTIVEPDGRITYIPAPDFSGDDSFTYKVSDNDGGVSNAATVSVIVAANDPPIAGNDTAATDQGTAVEITVLANDSDADGTLDPSTVAVQTGPGSGNAAVDAQGIVTYTPAADFAGTDTFTYTVADDDGDTSNAATVVVTVTSLVVDDPPFAADDTATTEPGVAVEIDVLANDGDADGTLDPATVVVQAGPDNGSTEVDEEGIVTYTPAADFAGTDVFTYTVADDTGNTSNAATVTVFSTAANEPPVAADDTAQTGQGMPVEIDLLANDSDADGTLDPATVAVLTPPANGGATVDAEGIVTYTPAADFFGTDTFTYTVADDAGAVSGAAAVTITVTAASDPSPPRRGGGSADWLMLTLLMLALHRKDKKGHPLPEVPMTNKRGSHPG